MWDKVQGEVLAAKFNPLSLGLGEAGYRDEIDDASTLSSMDRSKTSLSKSSKSSVRTEDKMASMVTSVINGVLRSQDDGHRGSGNGKIKKTKKSKSKEDIRLENQSLSDLMTLIEKHQNYTTF